MACVVRSFSRGMRRALLFGALLLSHLHPVHADPVHADPVHADPVHADPVHADPVHADGSVEPASSDSATACADAGATCSVELATSGQALVERVTSPRSALLASPSSRTLEFFWGVGCPHCEAAEPFVRELERSDPALRVLRFEVRRDPDGRRTFIERMQQLGAEAVGIPTFVVGEQVRVGYQGESTERELQELLRGAGVDRALRAVELPWIGAVNLEQLSLPALTVLLGLLDGVNPCAMWVLLVLLGVLAHVRSRARLLLFGGTFVLMSGVVYFTFMVAWSLLFELAGLSRSITLGLGVLVVLMGLINLKELFWFKRGISLTVPDRAKPGLFRRMRAIAGAARLPAALFGVFVLAFVVNLIELGCTLGLPAVYTRVLSLRELSAPARYAYLALYNLLYVVPLATIVLVYAISVRRLVLAERQAKVLKAVSGVLLLASGVVFIFWPELIT